VKTKEKMIRGIIPLVRVDCEKSIKLAKAINSPIIVIPIYDLISRKTAQPNKLFNKIKACGGIHNFLDYHGVIILSLIMKDELICKSRPKKYSRIIKGIKPDTYTSVDGATYCKQDLKSWKEVIRLSKETKELMKLCPKIKPIGHVKGCNSIQIKSHLDYLKKLGINIFIFHASDFFRNGDESMIQQAKHFCSLIKEKDNVLLVYGVGSPKRMLEFSFCDFFITYSHFVNAKKGKIFRGTKKSKFSKHSVYKAALHNFKEFLTYLKSLKYQTKLFSGGKCKWVEEQQELQLVIQKQKVRK